MGKELNLSGGISLYSLGLMVSLPLIALFNGGFDDPIVYWMSCLLISIFLYKCIKNKENIRFHIRSPLLWYSLFLVWSLFSMFWTINYVRTIIEFLQYVCYGFVFIAATKLNENEKFKVGRILLITGVGIALLGISEFIFINSSRIKSTLSHPNPFGIYLVILFLVTWGYYLRKPNKWISSSSLILLIALALTGSRGSVISLVIALPIILAGFQGKKLWRAVGKTVLWFIIALVLTQGIMTVAPYIQGNLRLNRTLMSSLVRVNSFIPSSVSGRLEFWEVAGRLIANKPIQGYGLGTYFAAYYLEYFGSHWYSRFTHNHYLQITVELGLVGLGMLGGFLLNCFLRIKQQLKAKRSRDYFLGALAGIIAFLLHIGIDFSWNFPGVTVLFFGLLGAVIGTNSYDCKKSIHINYQFKALILSVLLLIPIWEYSSETMYKKAIDLASEGKLEASNHVFDITNGFYPFNSKGYSLESNNYMELYKKTGDKALQEKAISLAERAVRLASTDGKLHNQLGNLYWRSGKDTNAEEHLILGAEYGAYALTRYIDLGSFYIGQKRLEDAERALLDGLELKEPALRSASAEEKEGIIDDIATLHLLLANVYQQLHKTELLHDQIKQVNELKEQYPFLQKYFQDKKSQGSNREICWIFFL